MEAFNLNNPSKQSRQSELFDSKINTSTNLPYSNNLEVNKESLMIWRNKIFRHQSKIIDNKYKKSSQQTLLPEFKSSHDKEINPFSLQPLSLNFWRTNLSIHQGPAMYFVIDNMVNSKIILYIGETNSNNLTSHQDIRFFLDVPKDVKSRRKLENYLIYLWLPPFNRETRSRWATTFTNN